MKIQEIIEKIDKDEGYIGDFIEVEEFILLQTKHVLTNNVVDLCVYVNEETNMLENNILSQVLFTNILKAHYFTDIELGINLGEMLSRVPDENSTIEEIEEIEEQNAEDLNKLMEIHDLLEEYSIIDYIDSEFKNDNLKEIIDYKINQKIQNHNSVYNVLQNIFKSLPSMEDIGNLMNTLPQELNSLKNLEILNPVPEKKSKKPSVKKSKK